MVATLRLIRLHRISLVNAIRRPAFFGVGVFLISLVSMADEARWLGGASDDWNTAANWDIGTVPSSSTLVFVDGGSPFSPVIDELAVGGNAVLGSVVGTSAAASVISGGIWQLSGSLAVGGGGTASLQISGGAIASTGGITIVGTQAGGNGHVDVDGTGSQWLIGGNLIVGEAGIGTLNVTRRSQTVVGGLASIGNQAGSQGVVLVDSRASLESSGIFLVGGAGAGSLTLRDGGIVSTGSVTVAEQAGSTGEVNIGSATGSAASSTGVLNTPRLTMGVGNGRLVLNHTDVSGGYRFDPLILGGGQVNLYSGVTTLAHENRYTGQTTVFGGTLLATNPSGSATGTSTVQVDTAGTLRGNGILSGAVTVDGVLAPGSSAPGVLTLGELSLNAGSTVMFRLTEPVQFRDFVSNDLVNVTGNLTLGGTLNADITTAGVYRLFNYGGSLSGAFANEVYTSSDPDFTPATVTVDTSVPQQVNLTAQAANQVLQFWEGGNSTPSGQPLGAGGNGLWNNGNTNWTNQAGTSNATWGRSVGVFAGAPGNVTISGNQEFDTLQFLTDGYVLNPASAGDGALVIANAAGSNLSVRSVRTIIDAPIVDGSGAQLTVSGQGTAVLVGDNTYTGGTTIRAAVVEVSADNGLGASNGGITLNSGVLRIVAPFNLGVGRSITLSGGGGAIDTSNFTTTLSQGIQGDGSFFKLGSGVLVLAGDNGYSGDTRVQEGTLRLEGAGQISQSAGVLISDGAVLDISGAASARSIQSLAGTGRVELGQQNLILTNAHEQYVGIISGAGGLSIAGGSETLSGDNTYTGETSVASGATLTLAGSGGAPASERLQLAKGSVFDVSGATVDPSIRSLAGTGVVVLGGRTLVLTNASDAFAGSIGGDGGLAVLGGRESLGGVSSYKGATLIGWDLGLSGVPGTLAATAANTLSNASAFTVQAAGTLDLQGFDQSIASLDNAGAVLVGDGVARQFRSTAFIPTQLTIQDSYTSNGGTLGLDTDLGQGISDKVVTSSVTLGSGGATGVSVAALGDLGAPTTGDGILLVQTLTPADPKAFQLASPVKAGAYSYILNYSGDSNSPNGWYLRSSIPIPPTGPTDPSPPIDPSVPGRPQIVVPNFRVEVASSMVAPALASRLGLSMLGTYHERVGATGMLIEERPTAWVRVFGDNGDVERVDGGLRKRFESFVDDGPDYSFELSGLQAGVDLYRRASEQRSEDRIGAYVSGAHIDSDIEALRGGNAGSSEMDSQAVGVYWTHQGRGGWYTDTVLQMAWYNDARAVSSEGQVLRTHGNGATVSFESGYPITVASNWIIEPQAQVIHQYISLDDSHDDFGQVQYDHSEVTYTRLGARLANSWQASSGQRLQAWTEASAWHGSGDDAEVTFTNLEGNFPVTLPVSLGGSWVQLGVGVAGGLTQDLSAFAGADYNISTESGDSSSTSFRVGVRYLW